jgi:hypothetical protein
MTRTGDPHRTAARDVRIESGEATEFVSVHDLRPADAEDTCLRPLGLCELGGCCDVCWYRPNHPRFQNE